MNNWAMTALRFAAFVSLGGFVFGYDASVISGVIGFVAKQFQLSDLQIGLVVSAPTFTAILAAVTVTPLADIYGRRTMLFCLSFLYVFSALFSAFAPDYTSLVVARAFGGYAFGSLFLAPVYIAETSPADKRGLMVSINQLNIVLGFSASYFVNYYLVDITNVGAMILEFVPVDGEVWRLMLLIEAVPALIWMVLISRIPESPRWLAMHGRSAEAKAVLAQIVSPDRLDPAVQEIEQSLQTKEVPLLAGLGSLISKRRRFVLLVGVLLAIVQQATGINAVFFYAPTIFEQSGVGTNAAFMQASMIGLTNVIFTLVAMVLIDKVGRKPLLITGLVGIFLSLMVTAYGFHKATYSISDTDAAVLAQTYQTDGFSVLVGGRYTNDVDFKQAAEQVLGHAIFKTAEADLLNRAIQIDAMLVLVGIILFVASFALSLGPVMWVMLSEIFPNRLRAVALAFTGLFNSGTSFTVQLLFPLGLSRLGAPMMFTIFALFALTGLVLVWRYLPETKGRTLEELEVELAK